MATFVGADKGAGEKSFENLKASIKKAENSRPERLLYALGIPGIGAATAKLIAKHCHYKWDVISHLTRDQLKDIEGIGDVLADSYVSFFTDPDKVRMVNDILELVTLDETEEDAPQFLDGYTFVITGSLNGYENRDALKAEIERVGGHVAGSVSAKTSYLINNNLTSTSGKNKKAHELGIPIINEEVSLYSKAISRWVPSGVARRSRERSGRLCGGISKKRDISGFTDRKVGF